jgi:adenine-specific DNA-methyltransferase
MVATDSADIGPVEAVEAQRLTLVPVLDDQGQAVRGQYFTPSSIARFMASLFRPRDTRCLRLLDAGAGIGSLSASWAEAVSTWPCPPPEIDITAYEIDRDLVPYLQRTLDSCSRACARAGIECRYCVRTVDFVEHSVDMLRGGLFAPQPENYDCVILNPPYFKIHSGSRTRLLLRSVGIETSNIYTAFLALSARLLCRGGEMVAITPRSYCNGSYFRPFREEFLRTMSPRRFHTFDTRDQAFQDDGVLQETVIMQAIKEEERPSKVLVSSSVGTDFSTIRLHETAYARVVHPGDPHHVIHLIESQSGREVAERMDTLRTTLSDLGLTVSTGRVVDFRARHALRADPEPGAVPLIWAEHLARGSVVWPLAGGRKPQAFAVTDDVADQVVPAGTYVLVKRLSSKEQRRRITAAVYDPRRVATTGVAFENHLNYYHCNGAGLPAPLSKGLAAYLNSTIVDLHFRQWSGHTQVNASDLRRLRYPSQEALENLGECIGDSMPPQDELDALVLDKVFRMPGC